MKIITAPHPTLRQVAASVAVFDKKFFAFLRELTDTLIKKEKPRGVGLAAPQVNKSWRVFVAVLGETNQDSDQPVVEFFINPKITKHSQNKIMGLADGSERFEGCLSIPKLYGPVPRYEWVEMEYQSLKPSELTKKAPQIITKFARFTDFDARVLQHELDHLDGILFTDYSLRENLPVYIDGGKEWVEVKNKKEILGLL